MTELIIIDQLLFYVQSICVRAGMEVKPCNGDPPLVDSEGKEYDCGSGPERRDCPTNSYCHQTTRFARCCKKG